MADIELERAKFRKFYLERFTRFARIANEAETSQIPEYKELAGKAVLSGYRDCASIGLEREAREILGNATKRNLPSNR